MGERGMLKATHRNHEDNFTTGSQSLIRQLLKTCQAIESRVSSLSRLENENSNLIKSLNRVEENFLTLLRTSQAEIAKLKHGHRGTSKKDVCEGRGKCTLDPRRSLTCVDIVQYLHTPVSYDIPLATSRNPVSCRQTDAHQRDRLRQCRRSTTSSSSSSSSGTSSSSSSSISFASPSTGRKLPRPFPDAALAASTKLLKRQPGNVQSNDCSQRQERRPGIVPCSNEKHRRTEPQRPLNYRRIERHYPPQPSMSNSRAPACRDEIIKRPLQSIVCAPHDHDFVSSAEDSGSRLRECGLRRLVRPKVNEDAKTGMEDSVERHLLRLVGASVRNSRMHHSASVELAPPTRGKHLSEIEKIAVETYLHAAERRSQSARARSYSPQTSAAFSSTLFTRRQMLKHASLRASPAKVADGSHPSPPSPILAPFRSPVAPKTPPEPMEETDSVVCPPRTPENEQKEDEDYEEEEEENVVCLSGAMENNGGSGGTPRVVIDAVDSGDEEKAFEENVSSVEDGEAMSEGEINDEDDDDEANGENNSHGNHHQRQSTYDRAHRNHPIAPHQRGHQHSTVRNHYTPRNPFVPSSKSHPRDHVATDHRRRHVDGGSPVPKRPRRFYETAGGFGRPRHLSPPANRRRLPIRPPPLSVAASRRRQFSNAGGGTSRRGAPGPTTRRTNQARPTASTRPRPFRR